MKHNQQIYKQKFDQNRSNIYYNVGDQVLKRLSIYASKLSTIYSNPMIAINQQHPTYCIQDSNDQKVHQVHVSS